MLDIGMWMGQVPLVLAWAMSIHKSQGQMSEQVKIDLRSVFEKGQSYVARGVAVGLAGSGLRPEEGACVASRARAERDEVDEECTDQDTPEDVRVEFELGGCCGSGAVMSRIA